MASTSSTGAGHSSRPTASTAWTTVQQRSTRSTHRSTTRRDDVIPSPASSSTLAPVPAARPARSQPPVTKSPAERATAASSPARTRRQLPLAIDPGAQSLHGTAPGAGPQDPRPVASSTVRAAATATPTPLAESSAAATRTASATKSPLEITYEALSEQSLRGKSKARRLDPGMGLAQTVRD